MKKQSLAIVVPLEMTTHRTFELWTSAHTEQPFIIDLEKIKLEDSDEKIRLAEMYPYINATKPTMAYKVSDLEIKEND